MSFPLPTGDVQCNLARLQAVQGLAASTTAVGAVGTAAGRFVSQSFLPFLKSRLTRI